MPDPIPTILYFGNDWAAENRTSSHHVARWLAKRYRVIYVESPGLRAPKGTGRDLKKLLSKVGLALRGPRATPEGLQVQTLLQIPLHGSELVAAQPAPACDAEAADAPAAGASRPMTWFVVPHLASVVGDARRAAVGLLLHRRLRRAARRRRQAVRPWTTS